MDSVVMGEVVGSPFLRDEKEDKMQCNIPRNDLERMTILKEVENKQEKSNKAAVRLEEELTDTPGDLFEDDPPELKIFLEKEELMDQEYEIKDFTSTSYPPAEEDPLKFSPKVEIKQEDFEIKEECSNDLSCVQCKISFHFEDAPKKSLEFFCVDCYITLRKEAYKDWMKKLYCKLESCLACLKAFLNCLDIEKHDCTRENIYYCSSCHIIMDRKENMIFHVKQCYEVKEQKLKESKNYIKESVMDAVQHYSSVSNDKSYQNEATSKSRKFHFNEHKKEKSGKFINWKTKKLFATRNHKFNYNYCVYCSKVFKYYSMLQSHLRRHTGENLFVCELCKKSFTYLSTLKLHLRTHSGKKLFACELCKKSFTLLGHLNRHIRTHTGEKPFVCKLCKKSFTQLGDLKRHIQRHNGEKSFVCEHCKKSFTRISNLKLHIQSTHIGEKLFECEHCKKAFIHLGDLKRHIQTHTGEKPFVCEPCKKSFTRLGDLKRHEKTHTGEKPFVCEFCKKSFTRISTLKRHVQRIHTGEKPFDVDTAKNNSFM